MNIVWFRSDLRTTDNPALASSLHSQELTRAIFIITEKQWLQHDWGNNKIAFVLLHVLALQKQLLALNIQLDILYCDYFKQIPELMLKYLSKYQAKALYFNCEYELNEHERDQNLSRFLAKQNIEIRSFHSQTLITPGIILTKQKTPYTVFTPFKRACYQYLYDNPIKLTSKLKPQANKLANIKLDALDASVQHYLRDPILKSWPVGEVAAAKILYKFTQDNLKQYKQQRDFPAIAGTSNLSAYLAVGAISVQQCFIAAINENQNDFASGDSGAVCWVSELLWRDFYKQIMFHYPELAKGHNFNRKYDTLRWLEPGDSLLRWQAGQTGVPIIDAAMRQLVTTGWMHNRLRMLVAMFLTKNLLIDWRHGEKFFSQHLIDLDFSSNNGGWQWSASTGTDAVPYFRVFNPVTQSAKFDQEGIFIKKYCPELISLNNKQIHDPTAYLTSNQLADLNYPARMVDLSTSRTRALEHFKACYR